MLIPYNTDAPLYHPPIATVVTIVLNVLLFLPIFMHKDPYGDDLEGDDVENVEEGEKQFDMKGAEVPTHDDNGQPIDEAERKSFAVQLEKLKQLQAQAAGQGKQHVAASQGTTLCRLMTLEFGKFRPWQWLTANYMHADIFHLLGNMFVLWGFGLVVEGKVGWWRFLLIYNAIGIVGWGFVQLVMIFAGEGYGLGASLAIFGLVVICLIWAPANEMQCLFLFGFRPISFEASIMTIAIGAMFLQLAISVVLIVTMSSMGIGLRITSEILHLIGGALGCVVGIVMVKWNLVDCENWDLFSVWAGKNIKTMEEVHEDVSQELEQIKKQEQRKFAPREEAAVAQVAPSNAPDVFLTQFRGLVAAGRPTDAWGVFCRAEQQCFGWHVPEPDFVGYISTLRKQQLWNEAAGAMQEYLLRYSERETTIRLALAQVFVQHLNRPRDAWQTLESVNGALLNPNEKTAYDKLRAACRERLAAAKKTQRPDPT